MIHQILKKDYLKLVKERERPGITLDFLLFKAENGKYYQCTNKGMAGVKEMALFNKELKQSIDKQVSLI